MRGKTAAVSKSGGKERQLPLALAGTKWTVPFATANLRLCSLAGHFARLGGVGGAWQAPAAAALARVVGIGGEGNEKVLNVFESISGTLCRICTAIPGDWSSANC